MSGCREACRECRSVRVSIVGVLSVGIVSVLEFVFWYHAMLHAYSWDEFQFERYLSPE